MLCNFGMNLHFKGFPSVRKVLNRVLSHEREPESIRTNGKAVSLVIHCSSRVLQAHEFNLQGVHARGSSKFVEGFLCESKTSDACKAISTKTAQANSVDSSELQVEPCSKGNQSSCSFIVHLPRTACSKSCRITSNNNFLPCPWILNLFASLCTRISGERCVDIPKNGVMKPSAIEDVAHN